MEQEKPLVTIFAISHKHKQFLWETLESIRAQTYSNIELIILDNASNDGSVEEIQTWISQTGYPCNLIINPQPYPVTKNCNICLSFAKGKYVQGIACDDILMPDKIKAQVALFEKLDEMYACIYTDVLKIDETGKIISTESEFSRLKRILQIEEMPSGSLINELSERPFIHAPSVLCRTSALKDVGGYNELLVYEDWAMWIELSKHGYLFAPLNEITVHYRILSDSLDRKRTINFYASTIYIFRKNRKFLNMKLKGAQRQWLWSILQMSKFSFIKASKEYVLFILEMRKLGIKHFIALYRHK